MNEAQYLGQETMDKLKRGAESDQGSEFERLKKRPVVLKGGELALRALPERFDHGSRIVVKGTVQGRNETTTVEVRTDLKEIRLNEKGNFWALEAVWEDENAEPSLLMNGNYFDRDGEEMVDYTTTRDEWDYKAMGESLVGKLTPWDNYNIGRYDSVSSVEITEL